ncbi:MAG: ATPase, T2SS/T4P/T4SS family [Clostridiales bacterium]
MITLDKRSIEEILLEQGVLSLENFKRARDLQKQNNKEMEEILLEEGFVQKTDILKAQAVKMQVDFVDVMNFEIQSSAIPKLIAGTIAKRHILLPLEDEDGVLTVAMKDPTDIFVIDDLRLATTREIKPVYADPEEIEKLLKKYFEEEYKNDIPESNMSVTTELPIANPNTISAETNSFDTNNMTSPVLSRDRLGRLMVKSGVINDDQLNLSLSLQAKRGGMIGEILVEEGFITKKTLFGFLEIQLGVPHISLEDVSIPKEVIEVVSDSIARRYKLVPVEKDGYELKVAMSDPMNIFTIDDLRLATGCEITPLLADEEEINSILDRHYGIGDEENVGYDSMSRTEAEEFEKVQQEVTVEIEEEQSREEERLDISDLDNAPIVKMVNIMFNKAVTSGASDIHIEPYEDCVMIRYRIDGQLVEVMKYDRKVLQALVARIKIISGLNIAEKRIPQDGRITMKIEEKSYDLRVSVLPVYFGEKIVVRIADKEGFKVSKKQLGFFEDDLEKFEDLLSNSHGIILVTGPTGSGKSTTLYASLGELSKPNINILTIEDPIESVIRGVNQVQVNTKAGLDFAVSLRSFLRQDPDIIMVGEIRDGETAEIASRAAITGHLVLSTLHTNDAPSSVTRLIDMGIEPFLASSAIIGVIAQRLVRKLCNECKTLYDPEITEKEAINASESEEIEIYKSNGCRHCNNTGYKGRVAVYEIMKINRELRDLISVNENTGKLKQAAIRNGMVTLRENCVRLVRNGITSVEEMLRVTYSKD